MWPVLLAESTPHILDPEHEWGWRRERKRAREVDRADLKVCSGHLRTRRTQKEPSWEGCDQTPLWRECFGS